MPRVLRIVPDTNVFIQCKPLSDVGVDAWDVDTIEFVVTMVVQRELDAQKRSSRGRLNKRARRASAIFRDLLVSNDDYRILREGPPTVILRLMPEISTDPELRDQLNYSTPDECLVGTASAVCKHFGDQSVVLLTDDTGPMALAKMVGVPFEPVPEDWLLHPEADEQEREIAALRAEIAKYGRSAPRFEANVCVGSDVVSERPVSLESDWYRPLETAVVEELINNISEAVPVTTDFAVEQHEPPSQSRPRSMFSGEWKPPSDAAITRYQDEAYPGWIKKCEGRLERLHVALNAAAPRTSLRFSILNTGFAPASNVRVVVQARGGVALLYGIDTSYKTDGPSPLPSPPDSPKGGWTGLFGGGGGDGSSPVSRHLANQMISAPPVSRANRAPERLFVVGGEPFGPVESFELECAQWQHQMEAKEVACELWIVDGTEFSNGLIELTVHASNLPEPFVFRCPVTVRPKVVSVEDIATNMVGELLRVTLDQ